MVSDLYLFAIDVLEFQASQDFYTLCRKRRFAGDSDSSSVSTEAAMQANGDSRFECHRLRRMNKARAQLRPINSESKISSFLCMFRPNIFYCSEFLEPVFHYSECPCNFLHW